MDKQSTAINQDAVEEQGKISGIIDSIISTAFIVFLVIGVSYAVINMSTKSLQLNHEDGTIVVVHEKFWGVSKSEITYEYGPEQNQWLIKGADGSLTSVIDILALTSRTRKMMHIARRPR